jgi:16S rRNA C1402 (ribose-2'-O) methylase RsmI
MRELSKQFQEIITVKSRNDLEILTPLGEFVVVYHIADDQKKSSPIQQKLDIFLSGKKNTKELSKLLAEFSTYSAKELYKLLN